METYIAEIAAEEENDEKESVNSKANISNLTSKEDTSNKGGIFQFLQANLLSDTSN